ncbi:PAS domain S-box protein [Microlunatus spumicola]|uniref:protein-glutamate O-methyltransferase n=1 Tax=Microlunatus spumicola TaxID=81499 RepID=A0ABP6WR75_9ACTN
MSDTATTSEDPGPVGPEDRQFEQLLEFLREVRGIDFTGYKRPSLMRRVRHRMGELHLTSFDEYQDLLQLQPDEFATLFNTVLINVTSFFRDADAWTELRERLVPQLLARADGAPIRVWSAGCASGQEAYSIAMVLHEALGPAFRERVKIYATDVDEHALNEARQASYAERELDGLPEGFAERYLDAVGGRFVVSSELRRAVIFGRNDLTVDAPISRIDVLLCRNLLMYFNAETQNRVLGRLGFALKPDGVLFLGKAEMLLNHADLFEPIDLKRRFFRRIRLDVAEGAGFSESAVRRPRAVVADDTGRLRNEILLNNPVAQLAVASDGRLAMINHRANAMLGLSDRDLGRPFQDLDVSYRPLELRPHLRAVTETRTAAWLREVEWRRIGPDPVYLDIQLVPLTDSEGGVLGVSISFTDVTRFRQLRVEVETANRQLAAAYEELQSTNEELETTNEELQSTVEELETTNEELQSTNEELETMNEELQSSNDEQQSSNDQLRERTTEVGELNEFMGAVLGSFGGAVVVLDQNLVVRVWTPQAQELWGLRPEETIGQSLLDLDSGMPAAELHPLLHAVVVGDAPSVRDHHISAVNRRGRTIDLEVAITPLLRSSGPGTAGALLLMEDVTPDV